MSTNILLLFILSVTCLLSISASIEYGVDCSFPHHSKNFSCGSILGDRESVYENYMETCRQYYSDEESDYDCDDDEQERLDENRERPQHLVNYTDTGYAKLKVPQQVFDALEQFYLKYRNEFDVEDPESAAVINYWQQPTYFVAIEGRSESSDLRDQIFQAVKKELETWTGVEQRPISLYGIRVYPRHSILAPHVDRYPLVSSAIINVDQEVEEPWPLEVIGRDGKAVNITMEIGEMILYESHSLVHGRPFPLQGRFFANVFCHFEPTGRIIDEVRNYAWKDGVVVDDFPPYIIRDSPEAESWRNEHPNGWEYEYEEGEIYDEEEGEEVYDDEGSWDEGEEYDEGDGDEEDEYDEGDGDEEEQENDERTYWDL